MLNELDGVEFIYKELNTITSQFSERIRKQFIKKYGLENVVDLIDKPFPTQLSAKKVYLQIGPVEPFFIDSQEVNAKEHNYEWKRGYNLRQFTMDQTFYKPGIIPVSGGQVSCGDQWLQRTIFTTERSFPSFTKRIRVISKKNH